MTRLLTYFSINTQVLIKDIVPPNPIPFSFNTYGWHIMEGLTVLVLFGLIILYLYNRKKNAYRREALSDLIKVTAFSPNDILAIDTILKRTAITAYPKDNAGSLISDDWYNYLAGKVKKQIINIKEFQSVHLYMYSGNKDYIINEKTFKNFVEFSKYWIRKHAV